MTHKQTTAEREKLVFEKRDSFKERKKEKSGFLSQNKNIKRILCIRYTHDYT